MKMMGVLLNEETNPLKNLWKHKQWKEMNKTVQDLKVEIESVKKTQTGKSASDCRD